MIRQITNTTKPRILYKYRDWSDKYHQKIITHQEIYFPKPSMFNDPFDGNIPIRWDKMTYEDCFKENYKLAKIINKNASEKQMQKIVQKIMDDKSLWHPDNLKKERDHQIEDWNNKIGLLSLSETNENILMWSHYANNHKGFVVGIDTNDLATKHNFDYIEPIKYTETYPIINGTTETTERFYSKFFTKSELWNYEKEWRISKNHIENRIVKLNKNSIKEIILGCQMNEDDQREIIRIIKSEYANTIDIYHAKKHEEEFRIQLEKINDH